MYEYDIIANHLPPQSVLIRDAVAPFFLALLDSQRAIILSPPARIMIYVCMMCERQYVCMCVHACVCGVCVCVCVCV